MRLHQRLGASILLTLLSLLTIFFLLPTAGVSAGLQRIALGTSIDQYAGGLWTWVKGKDGKNGSSVRVVVFGDSWADGMGMGVEEGREVLGRGRCWAGWLCEEVNCSALLSFAASQPSAAYPASPPTGAVTWKQLYTSPPVNLAMSSLPDLATQIQEYLSSQSDSAFQETIFAISFGFWDIYHLAGLDYGLAQNMTDAAVDHLVSQINLLYTHFMEDLSNNPRNESSSVPSFKLVIPKLFDPTLAPGWISQRSMPLSPSSVAEQQKQAVYLTERWNSLLENALGSWVAADANANNTANETDTAGDENQVTLPLPRKDIFYYDLPQYILDIIIEHQLEDAGQSDAAGLGKGESPFVSVAEPCLRDGAEDEKEEDGVWNTVCPDPSAYLFWDGFNLGGTANAGIGTKIAGIVNEGLRMGR